MVVRVRRQERGRMREGERGWRERRRAQRLQSIGVGVLGFEVGDMDGIQRARTLDRAEAVGLGAGRVGHVTYVSIAMIMLKFASKLGKSHCFRMKGSSHIGPCLQSMY